MFGLGILLVGFAAWSSDAYPEAKMPLGVITTSEARGPRLVGVLVA